jgi:ATP-dependent DNA ligase
MERANRLEITGDAAEFIEPMQCLLVSKLPQGKEWEYELKLVAKRRNSFYEPGRRRGAWVKMRIGGGQEFVIGGYTANSKNFDALLVGYYEADKLMFAAKVRNGFVPAVRDSVFQRFKRLQIKTCPFANLPESAKGRSVKV